MYPEVRDTVSYYEKYFYNPSSPYSASKKIRKELEKARTKLADMINAQPEEIYFTSGVRNRTTGHATMPRQKEAISLPRR